MNCKYCNAALPSNSGHCPNCGRMIPVNQLNEMRRQTDPSLNEYKNKDTYYYKKEQAYDTRIGKVIVGIVCILLIIIIIAIIKGS